MQPSSLNATPLIAIKDLSVHYQTSSGRMIKVLDQITLDISTGECVALVGESGCGKTTLGKTIIGQIAPSSGTIHFDSIPIPTHHRASRQRLCQQIQMIFQDPLSSLDPRMTIGQSLAEPLVIHHRHEKSSHHERVVACLGLVGLSEDCLTRYPHQFSGGQLQRIVIARAFVLKPRLIICDEPVSALDVSIQAQIINLLSDLQQQSQVSYLFISHNLMVVRHLCQTVAVMYQGRIVEYGAVDQVFSHPTHPYTRLLLEAIPDLVP